MKIEQTLNRPFSFTKFFNRDDVNAAAVEFRQTKTRSVSFQITFIILLYETKVTGVDKI